MYVCNVCTLVYTPYVCLRAQSHRVTERAGCGAIIAICTATSWYISPCVAITGLDERSLITFPPGDGNARLRGLQMSSARKSHFDAPKYLRHRDTRRRVHSARSISGCRVLICVRHTVATSSADVLALRRCRGRVHARGPTRAGHPPRPTTRLTGPSRLQRD